MSLLYFVNKLITALKSILPSNKIKALTHKNGPKGIIFVFFSIL